MFNNREKYAWLIFIGCCFLTAGGFALVYSLAGVYLIPVSTNLNISTVDVSFWLVSDGITSVIAMPIAGHLLQRNDMHRFIAGGSILSALGIFCFSFCTNRFHFILCGCLTGAGMPFLYGIAEVTLIGNWFPVKKQGFFLGIAMACQGFAAAVWAPLFTWLVQNYGYQNSYKINAILILLMILPWALFILRKNPEQLGMKPYTSNDADYKNNRNFFDAHIGMDRKQALNSLAFWSALIASCTVCLGMGFDNHQQAIAIEFFGSNGINATQASSYGAIMMSCSAIGTVVGDIGFGFIISRLGIKKTFAIFLSMFLFAFVSWSLAECVTLLLFVGSFLLGTHNGLASVGYPLLVRRLFGGRQCSKIYSIVNTATSFFGGLTTMIVSLMYELVHTYFNEFFIAMIMVIVLAVFSFFAISKIGKRPWVDENGNPAEPYKLIR